MKIGKFNVVESVLGLAVLFATVWVVSNAWQRGKKGKFFPKKTIVEEMDAEE